MDKYIKSIFILHLVLLLTGCGDQRILEDQAMIQAITYDKAKKDDDHKINRIQLTASIPLAKKEGAQKIISTQARSITEAQVKAAPQTDWNIVNGQLRSVFFGKSLAKTGLFQYLNTLERDPSIGYKTKVIIVNGNAAELLSQDYNQEKGTYEYLDQLIEKQSNQNALPKVDIYQFMRDYYDDGIDPIVPQLLKKKKYVETDGIALFQDDRYITHLDTSEGAIFMILYKQVHNGLLNFVWTDQNKGGKESLTLSTLNSKRNIEVTRSSNNQFMVTISVGMKGSVLGYIGKNDLGNKKERRILEQQLEQSLTEDIKKWWQLRRTIMSIAWESEKLFVTA